jgi:hypothetical protein
MLMTQPQLGRWAHRALLNDYNGVHQFGWKHCPELADVVYRLMALDQGPEFEVSPADLKSIIASLSSQLDSD